MNFIKLRTFMHYALNYNVTHLYNSKISPTNIMTLTDFINLRAVMHCVLSKNKYYPITQLIMLILKSNYPSIFSDKT